MARAPALAVTLSPRLFDHMKAEAALLGVPLRWLVAGIVLDTLEDDAPEPASRSSNRAAC